MHKSLASVIVLIPVAFGSLDRIHGSEETSEIRMRYRDAAIESGDAESGKIVFQSKQAACNKCHAITGDEKLAGPKLAVIGDKYTREQLIQSVLEPSARIHPDYATLVVTTDEGRVQSGVLQERTSTEIKLFDVEGKLVKIPLHSVEEQHRGKASLMPTDLHKSLTVEQFSDLIAFLTTLKQAPDLRHHGISDHIKMVERPITLEPFHTESLRFDHPVWVIAKPGTRNQYLVVEQQTCKVWLLEKNSGGDSKKLFVDMSDESITGQFEGVMCLAFHPRFVENGKYYLNHHVREDGIFSPVIVERQASKDLSRDKGGSSRRLLRILHPTDLHWGGMLAFGPDGYLYIGAGDGGPQEDPNGHGQNLSTFLGKILRIDVDKRDERKPYAIPDSNPFSNVDGEIRPEIWAYGFRMPWRFSWDAHTGDMWVGEIGQNLFEEVTIARIGENHGWNVYEGFSEFSNRYRRKDETFIPPVYSYRRKYGVSVTGGYVYRGKRSPSYVGAYIFSDFESKRIWALKQSDRKLLQVRQIGSCPEKPASFGMDHDGELFIVGYEGTIYRVVLDESVFD